MLNYTAIDFETANSYRGSPCSVGLVRVRDGIPVEECHWLIRPPEQVDHFDHFNITLHGITPEMVATAPRWKDVLPAIVDFIAGDVVVAHNAGLISVTAGSAAAASATAPKPLPTQEAAARTTGTAAPTALRAKGLDDEGPSRLTYTGPDEDGKAKATRD